MSWRVLLVALTVVSAAIASATTAAPSAVPTEWSDPIVVAETSVAVPPVLIPTPTRLHLFWLDRRGETAALFYSAMDPRSGTHTVAQPLATGVDTQFGWPVAATVGSRIVLAWMARDPGGVQLMAAVLEMSGAVIAPAHPLAPFGEESGSIAMLPAGDRIHLAWSQFDHGQRRIWYLQLSADGAVAFRPRPVALGESPTLLAGDPTKLIWWESTGFDTQRLVVATLTDGSLTDARPITGPILQVRVSPVFAASGAHGLDVLLHVVERGFGTRERLYHVRLSSSGGPSPLQPLLQARSVSEIGGNTVDGQPLVVWTAPAGRTQHLEVFAARFDGAVEDLVGESRVTYTLGGSLHPTIAAAGEAVFATWLEVAGLNRFRVAFATTQHSRRRLFLLGVPELDLFHPARVAVFASTVMLTLLPLIMVYAVGFVLPAMGLALVGAAVFGGFAWWDRLQERPAARLSLFLLVVLLLQIASRVVIPGMPGARGLLAALAAPAGLTLLVSKGRPFRQTIHFWLVCGAILVIQFVIILFPWGAHQLSRF